LYDAAAGMLCPTGQLLLLDAEQHPSSVRQSGCKPFDVRKPNSHCAYDIDANSDGDTGGRSDSDAEPGVHAAPG